MRKRMTPAQFVRNQHPAAEAIYAGGSFEIRARWYATHTQKNVLGRGERLRSAWRNAAEALGWTEEK